MSQQTTDATASAVVEAPPAAVPSARLTLDGKELDEPAAARTVRVRDGEVLVTDGPYAETKEQLGGIFLLDCEDLDQAIALAAKIPVAERASVELRPIVER